MKSEREGWRESDRRGWLPTGIWKLNIWNGSWSRGNLPHRERQDGIGERGGQEIEVE